MLISGSFYLNFSTGKPTQGMFLAVGFLFLAIVFGLRWFSLRQSESGSNSNWPPSINVCPDYLTLSKVDGKPVCLDTIGVSQQGMQVWSSPDQTDEKFLFNLSLDKIGSDRVVALCAQCKTKAVTWEGVWDGNVCLNVEPPRPI